MDRYHQLGIIQNVFQTWQQYFIPWEFKGTQDFDSAQWYIYWVRKNIVTMPDGTKWNTKERGLFDFVGNPDTLAVQFASPNLLCLINDDHDYSFDTTGPNSFDLYTVLLHEIAHGTGLGHTDHAAIKAMKAIGLIPIMGAYYDKHATITPDEEKAIRDLHGAHLNEFRDHPTILRLMQTFADKPAPLKENKGCLAKLLGG